MRAIEFMEGTALDLSRQFRLRPEKSEVLPTGARGRGG